jgi:hypothetical protein
MQTRVLPEPHFRSLPCITFGVVNFSFLPFKNTFCGAPVRGARGRTASVRDDQRIAINDTEFGAAKTTELHPSEVMPNVTWQLIYRFYLERPRRCGQNRAIRCGEPNAITLQNEVRKAYIPGAYSHSAHSRSVVH